MTRYINAEDLDSVVLRMNAAGAQITRGEYKLIDSVISEFPTVDIEPKWIPCSERLPDAGEIVLVCGKMGGIYTAIYSKQRANWDNGWWKLNTKSHRCDPKAWMPLPKQYKPHEVE